MPSDLVKIGTINVKLDVKFKRDFGSSEVPAGNPTAGKVVTFSTSFSEIRSITVTAAYQAANPGAIAIYDFAGGANPTQFTVYIYSTAGNRVAGKFSWSAEGV